MSEHDAILVTVWVGIGLYVVGQFANGWLYDSASERKRRIEKARR